MVYNEDIALQISEFLLQIKAIKLSPKEPFTWASGWKSPIYCDNRKTLSYHKIRTNIRQRFVEVINDKFGDTDVIAGVATGGIAMGALVAQELGLPFVYVRAASKEHGLQNQIEGVLESGQSVVIIEDLVSTGKSSLAVVEAVQKAEGNVKGMVAIFSYGFKVAENAFKKAKCPLITLSDYNVLLRQALKSNYINAKEMAVLEEWRLAPEEWGK
jgi:orotate phosphoribosyltransferase